MISRRSKKLIERFLGPYKVKAIISSNTVELELPTTVKIHPVINVSRIRIYISQVDGQQKEVPQLVIIEGEDVMETLDSTEFLMEDQAWLDYLWDFETREINLDLSSDTD